MPWQLKVLQWWLLKSKLDLLFSLKVPDIPTLHMEINVFYTALILLTYRLLIGCSSTGLVEKVNNFQTLSLRDFSALNLDPFLSIDDDYFYHTQYPRRPEVSTVTWTSTNCWPLCYWLHTGAVFVVQFLLIDLFFVCFLIRSGMFVWDSPLLD